MGAFVAKPALSIPDVAVVVEEPLGLKLPPICGQVDEVLAAVLMVQAADLVVQTWAASPAWSVIVPNHQAMLVQKAKQRRRVFDEVGIAVEEHGPACSRRA